MKLYRRILIIGIGVLLGVGSATFYYAKGYSYMLDDPAICKNCHIMNDQHYSWSKSTHRMAATCNDCHTPKNFAGKWFTKALNGWNHSYAFTTGYFHYPIQANKRNREIAEENCRYCHATMVASIIAHETDDDKLECTKCHRNVGHIR